MDRVSALASWAERRRDEAEAIWEEQIIGILNEAEHTGNIREVCRLNNISEQMFYRRRTKFGGMDVSEAKRLKELERENSDLNSKKW